MIILIKILIRTFSVDTFVSIGSLTSKKRASDAYGFQMWGKMLFLLEIAQ